MSYFLLLKGLDLGSFHIMVQYVNTFDVCAGKDPGTYTEQMPDECTSDLHWVDIQLFSHCIGKYNRLLFPIK